jgi:hypothetical protein
LATKEQGDTRTQSCKVSHPSQAAFLTSKSATSQVPIKRRSPLRYVVVFSFFKSSPAFAQGFRLRQNDKTAMGDKSARQAGRVNSSHKGARPGKIRAKGFFFFVLRLETAAKLWHRSIL